MKLFFTPTSPYARKLRVLIRQKQLQVTEVLVNPWQGDKLDNPLGKIPYLLQENPQLPEAAQLLVDSRVITQYLDQQPSDHSLLIPEENAMRFQVLSIEAMADGIADATAAMVMAMRVDSEFASEKWFDWQQQKIIKTIEWLDHQLQDSFWLVGDQMTVADIALVCALDFINFRRPDISWQQHGPSLHEWFDCCLKAKHFVDTDPRLAD